MAIYVNGEYRAENDIGKLMHDFSCRNPDEMQLKLLAEKTRETQNNPKAGSIPRMLILC